MPASGTMAAPFGRITSGRGFAPNGHEAHDLPAAGQFIRDHADFNGKTTAEAWLQQAKMLKSLQGMQRHGSSNQIPSAMLGLRPSRGVEDEEVQAAKRPRLMLPDYGRSASDPPLSFQRRNAHAMNVPVETLRLAAAKPAAAQMPKTLRSFQSGPARVVDGKPSPNYRIYSNAFQGGRVDSEGGPLNYSHPKAAVPPPAPIQAPTPSQQPARNDPTPHPAFLKQPLLSSHSDQSTSQQPGQGHSQRPELAPAAAESQREKRKEAGNKVQSEAAVRLQQMHSVLRDAHLNSSSSPSPLGRNPSPHSTSSPKHSASQSTHSEEDTEMEEASHGSHVVASAQGPSPRAAASSPKEAAQEAGKGLGQLGGTLKFSGISTVKSPAAGPRDSGSPTSRDGMAVEGEGEGKQKSLDSRDSRDASRKPPSVKTDVSSKGRPVSKAPARPWSNLSSALQPAGGVQDNYPPAQQAADAAKKNDLRREAIMAEGNLQQLLLQLADTQGPAYPQHGGMSRTNPQEHLLAAHSNLHMAPLQAPLHVMRNSFNRLARSEAEQAGGYPQAHPLGPSSFPPSGLSLHEQDRHRGLTAPNHKLGAVHPRAGPASSQPLMPISSSTLSSLPPSVAAFYESEQRQQHHQQHAVGSASALNPHLNGIKYSHRQQAQQHGRNPSPSMDSNLVHYLQANGGSAAGYARAPNPMNEPHMGSKGYSKIGLGSDSGYQIPSRVVTMDGGGVRNPALLNRPVLASHRDPQLSPRDQDQRYSREGFFQQGSDSNHGFYNQGLAQRDSSQSTRGPSSGVLSQQTSHNSSLHALGDVLSKSNLSSTEVEQLCKYAGSGYAGNLNQLITQLQLVSELAHAQSEPAQPLVETTHRVVIPAAHLKDRSHAISRQTAAPLANMRVQSGRSVGADGGNRDPQLQQGRAAEAAALREPQSALDVVAEVACEEADNEEPSELLMLAAETLAGLNTMQPRQNADHPKPAPQHNLDSTPGNDSPAAAQKLSKQLGDANRKQKRKLAQIHKAATASNVTTAAAIHASNGGVSVHPILGFSVPHSRRSYHRDAPVAAAKHKSSAPVAASESRKGHGAFQSSVATAPAAGRQRKSGAPAPHARSSFGTSDIRRAASDSSLTVSADST